MRRHKSPPSIGEFIILSVVVAGFAAIASFFLAAFVLIFAEHVTGANKVAGAGTTFVYAPYVGGFVGILVLTRQVLSGFIERKKERSQP